MIGNYASIIFLSCFAIVILCVLVYENARFTIETKRRFYAIYFAVILAALSEFMGFYLNGAPEWTIGLHAYAKCADFILSPIVAVLFVRIIYAKSQWLKLMFWLMAINIIIEIASIFTGWTFYIDEHNFYHHGPMYLFYMAVYMVSIFIVIASFYMYGTKFKKKNWLSIGSIGVLVATGVVLQEVVNGNWRTCILSIVLAAILQFIHYSEFWQQQSDEDIINQKMLLEKDALTGMMTRYAYNQMLEYYENAHALQKDHVVVSIDVNGLKNVNDTLGHAAGDELIKGAAECVLRTFSTYGKVFRTGGDEFVAVIIADEKKLNNIRANLEIALSEWHGELVDSISLSCGYVTRTEYPDASLNELLLIADKRMYGAKSNYYRSKGVDRRRSQKEAYDALCNSYSKVLKLNLGTDSYEIITADTAELTSEMGFSHSISTWLRNFAVSDRIHEDDKDKFIAETDAKTLRQFFHDGNDYKSLRYRKKVGGDMTTVLMELVKGEEYTPFNQIVYLYIKDISSAL